MTEPARQIRKTFDGILRPAREEDLPEIVRIENESFGRDGWPEWQLADSLQASLDGPYTTLVMAFNKAASPANDNGKAAGYGMGVMETATKGVIASMAVAQDNRGQGLGRILLDKVIENLRDAGATKITLQVETTNQVAIKLYESSGFVKEKVLKNYYGRKRDGFEMTLK